MQVIHRQQRVCDFSRMVHHYGLLYLPSWSQNSGDTRRAGQGWRASTEQWDQYRPLCVRRDKRSAARALQNYLQWPNHVHVLLPNLNTETMTVALRSFSGTCVHNRTPCRLTGICLRTPELAGPPTISLTDDVAGNETFTMVTPNSFRTDFCTRLLCDGWEIKNSKCLQPLHCNVWCIIKCVYIILGIQKHICLDLN